ncbi:sporulation integral membrane protein YtvI [Bacillus mesophilus]|uniref:Sporulation integral membrane protein YtvI n=1 Tax=Bacillus mesophilus TaxID=1808955 RepID=A0A6M0Q8Q6_9BACI|nr:sporulation integral membrane protein YtvI [Bacillus mesophilus]MBM7661897.1 sporulation integral membrane protein YtvI [Bacillus mesophilus]NEY72742.1 sporulation integral membrane protein YtvI [Bacillus mesophilus]
MKKYLVILLVLFIAIYLLPKSIPIILGLLTAIIFEPLILHLQNRWKLKRLLSVIIVFILFLSVTGFLGYLVLARLIEQFLYFSSNLPFLLAKLNVLFTIYMNQWEVFSATVPRDVIESIEGSFHSLEDSILNATSNLTQSILVFITTIPQLLIEILVYLIAFFLFSLDLRKLKIQVLSFFSDETRDKFLLMYHQLNRAGIGFLKAQLLFSVLTFILAYSGLLLLDVEYAVLLSIVIVFVDILPVLGTGSVLVPYAIYCFITNQQDTGIGLLILFLVITVVRRVIEPKVYSTNMGISPIASLISMYLGFQVLGFLGLILGPVVVIIYDTLKKAGILKFQFKI